MSNNQHYTMQAKNEARLIRAFGCIEEESGIYIFKRNDEDGVKHAYIGQAKNLLRRTAQHLSEYNHIGLSLKKRGLWDAFDNPHGWYLSIYTCASERLDSEEKSFIKLYAKSHQLYNKTSGGQGEGKRSIVDEPRKGYLQGKHDGEVKARKDIGARIEKYTMGLISKGGAVADRKTAELIEMFEGSEYDK